MALKWISVAEAAQTLGVSQDTVRRRAKRQMLDSRKGKAGRLEVRVPVKQDGSTLEPDTPDTPDMPDRSASVDLHPGELDSSTNTDSSADQPPQQEPADETPARAASGRPSGGPSKVGRYSPLPGALEGGGSDDRRADGRTEGNRHHARFAPGELLQEGARDGEPEDELKRYQRLAGASVILAQRQADEASEQVVMMRGEVRRLRKLCNYAWIGCAAALLLCLIMLSVSNGRVSKAHAALAAQEEVVAKVDDAVHSAVARLSADDVDRAATPPPVPSRRVYPDATPQVDPDAPPSAPRR